MSTGGLLLLATSQPVALPTKPLGLVITSVTENSISATWSAASGSVDRVGLEVTGEHILTKTERDFSTGIGRWPPANNAHDPVSQTLKHTVPAGQAASAVRFPQYASTLESAGLGSMSVRLVGAEAGRNAILYIWHYSPLGQDIGIVSSESITLTNTFAVLTVNDTFPSMEIAGGTTEFYMNVSSTAGGEVVEVDNASLVRASRTSDVATATSGTKSSLQANTQYSVVAYAQNAGGMIRSDPIQVTTLGGIIAVSSFAAFGIPL